MHPSIREIEKEMAKKQIDHFEVGDTVNVHVRIVEGEKERIQVFSGTVIARRGSGLSEMFTVRRLVQSEGVERTFPLHSPRVERVEVARTGKKRRAKLYFLRQRVGKGTRLAEDKRSREEATSEASGQDAGGAAKQQ